MRNLTKTLAVFSLLVPASGHSLGIGDIKLHSALNQNLNAEVSLVVSAGENAADIKVNLAPREKFDAAGVPWSSFLSNIKFATVTSANGTVLIKLSSKEAVKEPFLDFLLEVSWPKGSLYREFTVLLDPPTAYSPVLSRSETVESNSAVILQPQVKQNRQVSAERSLSVANEYGPTRRNDTLWKVAERASSQAGVSLEQMIIALYEENPHAFYKENIHALSAGKTLKIPKKERVLSVSKKQALAELNRQTNAWKNRWAPAPIEAISDKKTMPDNQLKLVAPTAAEVPENVNIAPENAPNKIDEAPSATLKASDKEVISVASPIADVLQSKITDLEKQLAMMQQIVALKDQQLAAIQNGSQTKAVTQAEPIQTAQDQIEPSKAKPTQAGSAPQPEADAKSSYLWLGIGMGTLSLLGWFWWRQRESVEKAINPSLFASADVGKTAELKDYAFASIDNEDTNNADAVGASPLSNAFTYGNFDADQSEIDPVSEADVYLAYGRYQQAEALMRDVIKDQPDRDECKLKLLEIYYSTENKSAFETYANELAVAGKKDDVVFWGKVTEMGRELCQDSPLFSAEANLKTNMTNNVKSVLFKKEGQTDINKASTFRRSGDNEGEERQNNDTIDFDLRTGKPPSEE